ncbi:TRAP transporter large permease [Brachybacterium hainanense]|uniref:TRAP transporter large permease n=1 Tax=Brachybacterium hainanense TaxID=1541174 RepID=A0ABV6R8B5_9MICO
MDALLLIVGFFALLAYGVPVAVSLIVAALGYILLLTDIPVIIVAQQALAGTDSFTLMAVPYFIVAGALMQAAGISTRIVNLARSLVGWMPGGLAVVTILASMFFAAMTGAGAATTAAVGGMMIPAMVKDGYHRGYASALQASGGVFGPIIPPSILMILYAVTAEVSVGDMLIAGILPGILLGLMMIVFVMVQSQRKGFGTREPFELKKVGVALKESFWALLAPIIILGGIYTGIFTPTEAAAIGCFYSLVVGVLIYREITVPKMLRILFESFKVAAGIMLIVGGTQAFGWVLTREGLPQAAARFFADNVSSPLLFLLIAIVLFLVAGCFIDAVPNVLIFGPILVPVAVAYGIDPIHFGIVMVVAFCAGLITPPVGVNLFVASEVGGTPLRVMIPHVWPFFGVIVAGLVVLALVPWFSLALIP